MNIDMTIIDYFVDFFILLVVYIVLYFKKYRKLTIKKRVYYTLLYIYIVLVLRITLMPFVLKLPYIFNGDSSGMNLNAYSDLINNVPGAKIETILNIIMFMPFGFLLPIVKDNSFLKVVLYTFLVTLSIEILQPLINSYRASDITDVINNTLGGIIGYTLYLLLKPLLKKLKLL